MDCARLRSRLRRVRMGSFGMCDVKTRELKVISRNLKPADLASAPVYLASYALTTLVGAGE